MRELDKFFYASSIAVIGASNDEKKAGYQIIRNLVELGYVGEVYPVNPKEDEIFGIKCYASLKDIDAPVDLILVSVPAPAVPGIFLDAKERGDVQAAVILASGFSETRIPERVELEEAVIKIAKEANIRVMGPNCVGIMNTENRLDTTFAAGIDKIPGSMSLVSQSGSLGATIAAFSVNQAVPVGFAKWAHVGNQSDIDVLDVIKYYKDDEKTKSIAMYMEGIDNAREFIEVAKDIAAEKAIVVLKVGRSELGSGAAASHTGSLVGADELYEAAFEQAGVLRVDTIEELLDTAKAISMQPLPQGNRIAVLTEAGGPGIISVDEIGMGDVAVLPKFSPETLKRLRELLPPMAIIDHTDGYVDMSAAADERHHAEALKIVLEDENVDGIIHLSVLPTFLNPKLMGEMSAEAIKQYDKPVTVCYLAGEFVQEGREALENAGIPTFEMPDRAAKAMINMVRRRQMLDRIGKTETGDEQAKDRQKIDAIIEKAKEQKVNLTEVESRQILAEYDIDFGQYALATSIEDAALKAEAIGYPLVLKIMSPDIIHKSDAGGVIVNVKNVEELKIAYAQVMKNAREYSADARINGVLLTPMLPEGTEMIIGAIRDAQFGPCVMVGFGGIFVEVLKDVNFKMAPVSRVEARDMVEKLKLFPVLDGIRGRAKLDVDAVVEVIMRISRLIVENEDIKEIDVNPIRVYEQGISALDARVII